MEKNNYSHSTTDATNNGIDRISSMPDDVRVHILSFLTTKEAVRTCVLSKRWIDTWAFVPVLLLDIKGFLPGNKLRKDKTREYEAKLERFANGVLRNRKVSSLDKFVLLCHGKEIESCRSCKYSAFRGCILRALAMKPRVFAVCVCKHKLLKNDKIFTCASLEDVMVGLPKRDRSFQIAPNSIHLPRLKTLILGYITVDDAFLSKLFSGCPVIEELSLQCCNLIVSKISSGTLKKLALGKCDIAENLQICTPAIVDLEISTDGHRMGSVSLNAAGSSLANAKIDFSSCLFHDHIYTEIAAEVLNNISSVTSLNLTLSSTQVKALLKKGAHNLPIFNNLKSLHLGGWDMWNEFGLVAFFLRLPQLQTLVLQRFEFDFWSSMLSFAFKDLYQEKPEDVLYQKEHLDLVEIRRSMIGDERVDWLVNKLRARVKTIGQIKIV